MGASPAASTFRGHCRGCPAHAGRNCSLPWPGGRSAGGSCAASGGLGGLLEDLPRCRRGGPAGGTAATRPSGVEQHRLGWGTRGPGRPRPRRCGRRCSRWCTGRRRGSRGRTGSNSWLKTACTCSPITPSIFFWTGDGLIPQQDAPPPSAPLAPAAKMPSGRGGYKGLGEPDHRRPEADSVVSLRMQQGDGEEDHHADRVGEGVGHRRADVLDQELPPAARRS